METSKINTSKIKAAGKNFLYIGYTLIVGIVISISQAIYSANADISSRMDMEAFHTASIIFSIFYILCAIISEGYPGY